MGIWNTRLQHGIAVPGVVRQAVVSPALLDPGVPELDQLVLAEKTNG